MEYSSTASVFRHLDSFPLLVEVRTIDFLLSSRIFQGEKSKFAAICSQFDPDGSKEFHLPPVSIHPYSKMDPRH